ncbi:hypothetical protein [Yinghuangia soli]|uniref:Uncharacterized protein n=1 Tax=Yinghuangia soli TaxID=2908204 RepID=A0AA41TY21_9ACTN|nr:hypothetical protein [Yinghuangia soli]MCF2525690.1 hypothetical protein [Yinghuangia soli]
MTTYDTEDLRSALAAHAEDAPEGRGILEAAKQSADRKIRHRRRNLAVAGAFTLVLTTGLATGMLLGPGEERSGDVNVTTPTGGTSTASAPPKPTAAPFTSYADLKPGSDHFVRIERLIGDRQSLTIQPKAGAPDQIWADVVIYAPGTFDPARYLSGEEVTVQGTRGYFAELPGQWADPSPSGRPAPPLRQLAWQEPSGRWVVVTPSGPQYAAGGIKRASIIVAEMLRFQQTDFRGPVKLGGLPTGFLPQAVQVQDGSILLEFSDALPTSNPAPFLMPMTKGFSVTVADRNRPGGFGPLADAEPLELEQGQGWYVDWSKNRNGMDDLRAGIVVETSTCRVHFGVSDRTKVPRAELERIVRESEIKDCTDPTTWVKPLG